MKLKLFILGLIMLFTPIFANEIQSELQKHNSIQAKIDSIGVDILNYNKIPKRVVFAYNDVDKKRMLDIYDELTKRQVVVYGEQYKNVSDDNELAAMLAREIALVIKSYNGLWGGRLDALQVATSSKKFEVFADKRAVDFMVKAKYNPVALITYINKTCPQKRSDKISRSNLTSKRMAIIYEYITYKYPEFLENNEYENNKYYQNFLLTSLSNRAMLKEKIRTKSTKALKYE
ncbi:MAG: hypothetical protein IKU37_08395 [Candidatus Gastranaerophilales bacterium]|nr:hypothetical protein [Candidatus Gastranaerophilales bacterium]